MLAFRVAQLASLCLTHTYTHCCLLQPLSLLPVRSTHTCPLTARTMRPLKQSHLLHLLVCGVGESGGSPARLCSTVKQRPAHVPQHPRGQSQASQVPCPRGSGAAILVSQHGHQFRARFLSLIPSVNEVGGASSPHPPGPVCMRAEGRMLSLSQHQSTGRL